MQKSFGFLSRLKKKKIKKASFFKKDEEFTKGKKFEQRQLVKANCKRVESNKQTQGVE